MLSDNLVHVLLVVGGLATSTFLHSLFDYLSRKFWTKIDETSSEYKQFKAWKKGRKKVFRSPA